MRRSDMIDAAASPGLFDEDCGRKVRLRRSIMSLSDTPALELLPRAAIFERFRQIDSSITRRHGGLGLGLGIVRHIVEAHGGSVEAHSDAVGAGAMFEISLPVGAAEPAASRAATPSSPDRRCARLAARGNATARKADGGRTCRVSLGRERRRRRW